MLHTMDTQKLRNKTELYLDPINSTTRNYESIKCKDGWIYNRTMFPNTVVMEVLITILYRKEAIFYFNQIFLSFNEKSYF